MTSSHCHPGLRGQHLEMIPSIPESSSVSLCAQDDSPGSLPEVFSPQRASNSSGGVFPLPSSLANIPGDTTDSEPGEEADRRSCEDSGSESENEEERSEHEDGRRLGSVGDEDNDDGDEDKDYDEVVVKPRPLNEVTSSTDKTSPWTSVLSDLDMVSLESVEETNEAILSPAVGDCGEQNRCDGRDANSSAGDASNADCGDERTRQTEEKRRGKESESPSDLSHEKSLSPHRQEATAFHYALSSQDKQPQAYPYPVCCGGSGCFFFLVNIFRIIHLQLV